MARRPDFPKAYHRRANWHHCWTEECLRILSSCICFPRWRRNVQLRKRPRPVAEPTLASAPCHCAASALVSPSPPGHPWAHLPRDPTLQHRCRLCSENGSWLRSRFGSTSLCRFYAGNIRSRQWPRHQTEHRGKTYAFDGISTVHHWKTQCRVAQV